MKLVLRDLLKSQSWVIWFMVHSHHVVITRLNLGSDVLGLGIDCFCGKTIHLELKNWNYEVNEDVNTFYKSVNLVIMVIPA